MIVLSITREVLLILALFALLTYSIFGIYNEYKRDINIKETREKTDKALSELHEKTIDVLLEKADDERPIMLMVNPDKVARIVEEKVTKKILKTERRLQNEKRTTFKTGD